MIAIKNLVVISLLGGALLKGEVGRRLGLGAKIDYGFDMIVAAASVSLVVAVVANKNWALVPLKYFVLFFGFIYVAAAGIAINSVSADTVIAGIRAYFKFVPFFLIPFAFQFSRKDYSQHFKAMLVLMVIQIPVSVGQRFFEFATLNSGDVVRGTFTTRASLSILGVSFFAMLIGLYS